MPDSFTHIGSVDLEACDREPIHIIGTVQPHGALLAADSETLMVTHASENAEAFWGSRTEQLLHRPLSEVIGSDALDALLSQNLSPAQPDHLRPWSLGLANSRTPDAKTELYAHQQNGHLILEVIKAEIDGDLLWDEDTLRQRIITELVRPDATDKLAQVSADIVRMVTEFDRVMIYRFAHDNHGEVIAESTNRDDSFLGLHYPASDIPEPARRHFLLNIIRNIPDIGAKPSAVIATDGLAANADSDQPLDLTYAKLRGVSPVHLQYLANMGVRASLSISLTTNDRLWGLVACHHYQPHLLTSSRVRFVELLGATISTLLQSLENTEKLRRSISSEKIASTIEADTRAGGNLIESLTTHAPQVQSLLRSNGMLVKVGDKTRTTGISPDKFPGHRELQELATDGLAAHSNMSSLRELNAKQWSVAAGAALMELSEDGSDYVLLTREHFVQTIRWAGKPEKVLQTAADGSQRLSPRGSFAVWSEERLGHSEPFDESDLEALRILRRALFALNSRERERAAVKARQAAERDRAQLRHALLEAARKSSLGELASALAHELSQPLFAVSNYVNASRRELENLDIPITENIRTMMDEAVSDAVRAADLVRRLRDFIAGADLDREAIDIEDAIRQGVELALVAPGQSELNVVVDIQAKLPKAWADHVQISLVILNLVRNSAAAVDTVHEPRVTIRSEASGNDILTTVTDNGRGIDDRMRETLFEPFHRSTTQGMGIGLSLCRSIVEAHSGRIWSNPVPRGAQFAFTLPVARDSE